MRNFISHEYANIDKAIVKKICLESKKPKKEAGSRHQH